MVLGTKFWVKFRTPFRNSVLIQWGVKRAKMSVFIFVTVRAVIRLVSLYGVGKLIFKM